MTSDINLLDLPIEVQSHILQNLSPQLASCKMPFISDDEIFTDDLLHAAQSSSALSKAVVYTVGSKAEFLSFYHSLRIWEWIPLLEKHVKYFSFCGVQNVSYPEHLAHLIVVLDIFDEVILKTLKALHYNDVALEELDLERLKMINPEREEDLVEHMIKAIQRSNLSLRKITLTVNRVTAMAMCHVTLPNLEVAEICRDDDYIDAVVHEDFETENPAPTKNLGDILKAINGPADRHENFTALRDIRLYNVHEPPIVDQESCPKLFSAVEKLTMTCAKTSTRFNEVAEFIGFFRNVKTLDLSINSICAEDMLKIIRGCSDLEKLELHVRNGRFLSRAIDFDEVSSGMKTVFESLKEKLWKLKANTCFFIEHIKCLGENSPNLRILEMEIDSENMPGLTSLLGTHCRKLRELHLQYSRATMGCLGPDGWPALAQAICSASDELRVIDIHGDWTLRQLESATNEMVDSIIKIIQLTGHHASSISFNAPIDTHNPFIVLEALWRILNVAKNYRNSIENLRLKFIRMFAFSQYWVDTDAEEEKLLRFSEQVSDFQNTFFSSKNHTEVDLGDTDKLCNNIGIENGDVVGGLVDEVPNDQIAG